MPTTLDLLLGASPYERLKDRWGKVIAWGVEQRAPETRAMVGDWRRFSAAWESFFGSKDPETLRAQAMNLQIVEGNAQLRGYSNPPDVPALSPDEMRGRGAPMVPSMVPTPSPEDAHPVLDWIDRKAPDLPGKGPGADPYLVPKGIAVGALALGTVAATATAKSDVARAGIALGGLLATGLAGWLAFKPKAGGGKREGA
jgi:hypothetical protein